MGHEAKGLVLPDFDLRGILSNRFDAGVAKRLDDNHLQLRDLKMTSYTEQKPDLQLEMSEAVLDLKTRHQFETALDRAPRRFRYRRRHDAVRYGDATRDHDGNVKMVIRATRN